MENLFNEVWKPVKGFEGLYEISNKGNVRSVDRHVMLGNQYCLLKGKPIKPFPNSTGYLRVGLSKNSKDKKYLVHRLVAEAFIPNPNNLPCIDHINTIRDDNKVENLRWCDTAGNLANPISRERRIEGIRRSITPERYERANVTRAANIAKRPYDYIMGVGRNGEPLYFRTIKEASEYLNVPIGSLGNIMSGNSPVRDDFKIWFKGKEHLLREKKPHKVFYPPVIQLDENKKPIRSFKTCRAAAEELGFHIGENIRIAARKNGKAKAYGYYWKFEKN